MSNLKLTCEICETNYMVGEDSIIITTDSAMDFIKSSGAIMIGGLDPRQPDLVANIGSVDANGKIEALEIIEMLRHRIKNGEKPTWICDKCRNSNNPNSYPEDL